MHELSILICLIFTHKKFIFQTDAMGAFNIDPWFISDDHIAFKDLSRNITFFPPEIYGGFMDVKQVSYAMPGAMIEADPFFPENFTRNAVQICSAASMEKDGVH